jgi:RNA polymerase subunit RPABC4/transcription elongation factor Spt4
VDVVEDLARRPQLIQHQHRTAVPGGTLFDHDAKLRTLSRLEASSDPDSPSIAELIRAMDAAVEHLADALSCSVSLAENKRQPCAFHVDREHCACERCGQLLSEWELRAAAALECALPDSSRPSDPDDEPDNTYVISSPENLTARAERVQMLFRELEDVFGGLSLPVRAAEARSTRAISTLSCEGCGALISAETKFCPHCGRTAQGRRCLSCNSVLSRDMQFCPTCGAKAA